MVRVCVALGIDKLGFAADNIAAMYKASKMHPWRTHVELNTFFTQVPDQELKGADVLVSDCYLPPFVD